MKKFILRFFLLIVVSLNAQNYNFLGNYTSDGTPLYLVEDDIVDQETLDAVALALPEGFPVPDYNPQYISSGYDTDIIVTETADVWVTFVGEGAGYKNVLGFYTYNINDPLTEAPAPEDITIIFPNVSAQGSGGGLQVGNKVKIGRFEANTGIGWVLLADAWSNGSVGYGRWQLFSDPDFNPEADPNLRYHNVLLADPENERIILGFEDIRRDYGSCDNDFNDALFYVSANPYRAINNENLGLITDYTPVTSGNDGGLESNGDLATLIAKRNFERVKNKTAANAIELQTVFQKDTYRASKTEGNLYHYFPETGFYGTEIPYKSSPEDLVGVTNAKEVFSIDYYQEENRVLAALATLTESTVYDHSKVICDRLNSSKLEDVRTISLKGHKIIYSKLKRANGETEYALTFSVLDDGSNYNLYSLWNIEKYPGGNYRNFQVWGMSMPQVCTVAGNILTALAKEKTIKSNQVAQQIPDVFISNGKYENGQLKLELINRIATNSVLFNANKRETELSDEISMELSVPLTGSYREEVVINTGNLFDVGFALITDTSSVYDAMYLADGPWGIDYNAEETRITEFEIMAERKLNTIDSERIYQVERSMSASGEVMGTVNVFRTLLPGDQLLNVENYDELSFTIQNNKEVEVILLTDETPNWEDRLTYALLPNENQKSITIPFTDFIGLDGNSIKKIRTVIFSVQGDYMNFSEFNLNVSKLAFTNQNVASEEEVFLDVIKKASNYPNPFSTQTHIEIPFVSETIYMEVFDLSGRSVLGKFYQLGNKNTFIFNPKHLNAGFYTYIIRCIKGEVCTGKFIVK
ncbi:DUF4114 domain-containing protein [Ascidiimonas sp. W6]|uniref:DUF4114 domain-containing protein n=1 Tax=Ascidiimonas meishanensis TaxID=3128903 RepID=UPI0030EC0B2B